MGERREHCVGVPSPGSSLSPATDWLCDLGQGPCPLFTHLRGPESPPPQLSLAAGLPDRLPPITQETQEE